MKDAATFRFDEVFDAEEYLYFYEETLRDENTPGQVDFIARELALAPGAQILDLGCGHGRHSNELARRGYGVVGVVPGFLERARAEADREGLAVDYVLGDARGLSLRGEVDHVVCLFDAFGFLDDDGNEAVLQAVHAALRPGGALLLDVRSRDWVARHILPFTVLDKGGDMMIDRHHFDMTTGRLVDTRTFVRDGRVRTVRFSIRLYSYTELRALLSKVGFVVERAFGGWDGTPLSFAKNRMVVVARRGPSP